MIQEGKFMRSAGLNRALASSQALLDQIQEHCKSSRTTLVAEYWALFNYAKQVSENWSKLPGDAQSFKKVLLRMKEIARTVIVIDETIDGAKYGWDSDPDPGNPTQTIGLGEPSDLNQHLTQEQ
jgi:hypothetical protein